MLVWTLKRWERQFGGQKVVIPPGKPLVIELRSELEEGLANGTLTKDREKGIAAANAFRPVAESSGISSTIRKENPEVADAIRQLARDMGMPYEGARVQYESHKKEMSPDVTPDQICYAVRKSFHNLTVNELLIELCNETGLLDADAREQVEAYASKFGRKPQQIIHWMRFAFNVDAGRNVVNQNEVFTRLHELQLHGVMTEPAAIQLVQAELMTGSVKETVESMGGIAVNSVVKVVEEKHQLFGLTGKVLGELADGRFRVHFDEDPEIKKFRIMQRNEIDVAASA